MTDVDWKSDFRAYIHGGYIAATELVELDKKTSWFKPLEKLKIRAMAAAMVEYAKAGQALWVANHQKEQEVDQYGEEDRG